METVTVLSRDQSAVLFTRTVPSMCVGSVLRAVEASFDPDLIRVLISPVDTPQPARLHRMPLQRP